MSKRAKQNESASASSQCQAVRVFGNKGLASLVYSFADVRDFSRWRRICKPWNQLSIDFKTLRAGLHWEIFSMQRQNLDMKEIETYRGSCYLTVVPCRQCRAPYAPSVLFQKPWPVTSAGRGEQINDMVTWKTLIAEGRIDPTLCHACNYLNNCAKRHATDCTPPEQHLRQYRHFNQWHTQAVIDNAFRAFRLSLH